MPRMFNPAHRLSAQDLLISVKNGGKCHLKNVGHACASLTNSRCLILRLTIDPLQTGCVTQTA